jgi:hypothetical protein
MDTSEDTRHGPVKILLDMKRVLGTGRAMDRTPTQLMLRKLMEEDASGFFKLLERYEKNWGEDRLVRRPGGW